MNAYARKRSTFRLVSTRKARWTSVTEAPRNQARVTFLPKLPRSATQRQHWPQHLLQKPRNCREVAHASPTVGWGSAANASHNLVARGRVGPLPQKVGVRKRAKEPKQAIRFKTGETVKQINYTYTRTKGLMRFRRMLVSVRIFR